MGEEKIHALYLQPNDTSNHGPSTYRTVPYAYAYEYASSKDMYVHTNMHLAIMACIKAPTVMRECDNIILSGYL